MDADGHAPAFVAAVAGAGLGRTSEPVSAGRDWGVSLDRIAREQMTGLAVAGVQGGELELTELQQRDLWSAHRSAMTRAVALERRLMQVGSAFEDASIELVVLKGPAIAHTVYPDPAWRGFRDIDVLVRAADLHHAQRVLADLGFRRDTPEPRPRFDVRFGKAICHTDGDGLQVDLHRTLVLGPFGLWMQPDELFEGTIAFSLGDRSFRRLPDDALFVHACVHATLGWRPPLFMPLRDVIQIARAAPIDWDEVAALAQRWKLSGVLRQALDWTYERIPGARLPSETEWFRRVDVPRRERRAIESYTSSRRLRGGTALATLSAIRGPWQKSAYIRSLLFPDRPFLKARAGEGHKASHLKRWIVPLRWLTDGARRTKAR